MEVYLGYYTMGEYEDYEKTLVGVYASKALAEKGIEKALRSEYSAYCEEEDDSYSYEEWEKEFIDDYWVSKKVVISE